MTNMQRRTALVAVLGVGLALSLAACGSESADTSANITFRSDPPAQVWIAGASKGTTPVVLALTPGSHPVEFKADGFESATQEVTVESGKDLTIEAVLKGASTDESTVTLLASILGIEHAPFEAPALHRGGSDASVMLYWPQRDVRKDALTSFRIDVTEDYEGDGFIEFRKGSKVLHREPFNPASYETVKAMPETVREAIKSGSKVQWGVYFENSRKKAVTTDFKVISGDRIERKLAKLESSKFFKRQEPLMQEMLRVDVLRNSRLYSEALVYSLGILHANPSTTSPFKPIVESLQRLKLKDTPLFAFAATKVGGKGGHARPTVAGGMTNPGTADASAQPLPPVLSAPRLADNAPTGQGTFTKGAGGGGIFVRPTEEAAKDPIAGTDPAAGEPTVAVDPGQIARDRAVAYEALIRGEQAELDAKKQLLEEVKNAEQRLAEVNADVDDRATELRTKQEAAEAALENVRTLEDAAAAGGAGAPTEADVDAAKAAAARATRDEREANSALEQARQQQQGVAQQTRSLLGQTGSADQLQEEIQQGEENLEKLKNEQQHLLGPQPEGEPVPVPADGPDRTPPVEPNRDPNLAARIEAAQAEYEAAETAREAATADLETATQAVETARTAFDTAKTVVDDIVEAGGIPTQPQLDAVAAAAQGLADAAQGVGAAQDRVEQIINEIDRVARALKAIEDENAGERSRNR